jgi:hypothetical protein
MWARLADVALTHAGDLHDLREAARLSSVAIIDGHTGAHAVATELYQRVLAIREAALAADHPLIATTLHNLGQAEYQQGANDAVRTARTTPTSRRSSTASRASPATSRGQGPAHPRAPVLCSTTRASD